MKKIIILLLILTSPIFAEVEKSNFKNLLTQTEKQIFLDSINKYRLQKGLKKVEYSSDAERLAKIRTQTIYNHLKGLDSSEIVNNYKSHLHFGLYNDYLDFNTKLELYGKYNMTIAFENVIFISRKEVDNLIKICFIGWKDSPGHWAAMMSESIDCISLNFEVTDIGIIADLILYDEYKKKKK